MKKYLLFLILIMMTIFSCNLIKYKEEIKKINIENIDLSRVRDGEYEGLCDVNLVTAKVLVTVKNKRISKIRLLEHKHGKGYDADRIMDRVIEMQSLQVDTITGATGSSKVMLMAIESALKKGI